MLSPFTTVDGHGAFSSFNSSPSQNSPCLDSTLSSRTMSLIWCSSSSSFKNLTPILRCSFVFLCFLRCNFECPTSIDIHLMQTMDIHKPPHDSSPFFKSIQGRHLPPVRLVQTQKNKNTKTFKNQRVSVKRHRRLESDASLMRLAWLMAIYTLKYLGSGTLIHLTCPRCSARQRGFCRT